MTWTYRQHDGETKHNGDLIGIGYSGAKPDGLNNPDAEALPGTGPIPRGMWRVGPAHDHPHLGAVVMNLFPVGHDAHGRTAFRIHGDSVAHPGTASEGCIILSRAIREQMRDSGDTELEVTR